MVKIDSAKERARKRWEDRHPFRRWASFTISLHKRRGFEVNIALNELEKKASITLHCEYCGILLRYGPKNGKVMPNSPTLDRINNEMTLDMQNTRILCYCCNNTKQSRTHIEFIKYCKVIADKFNSDI
jgi:hypothetical protein